MVTGGCHCGAIRYEAEGDALTHALCHCTDCRRHAGAPMVGWTMYRHNAVKVTKGSPKIYEFLGTGPAAFLSRLRHRAFLHQYADASGDHRHSKCDL